MAGNLTARKVQTAKPGKYSEGGALYLVVSPTGSRKWVLRFIWRGKAKEMGLGSATAVDLADARERAAHASRRIAWRAIPSGSENALAASPRGCGRRGAGGAFGRFSHAKHKAHGQKNLGRACKPDEGRPRASSAVVRSGRLDSQTTGEAKDGGFRGFPVRLVASRCQTWRRK